MGDHSEAFVAFDTSKLRNAVAIADGGRGGEVRFLGEIENSGAATAKLVGKLASKYERLTFCYEAGPTGYGLQRQGKHYPDDKKTWTKAHMAWLASQKLDYPEQRLVFEEMMLATRQAEERMGRLEQAIRVAVPDWSLAEVVTGLMAMRGMDLI